MMISLSKFCSNVCNRVLSNKVYQSSFILQQRWLRSRGNVLQDKLPEKPKRPPSPWLLFLSERRKELQERAEYKDLSLMEMSKMVSEEWRAFDELDKIPYKERYSESMSEYRNKMEDYKSNLTPEDKRLLRLLKMDEKHDMKAFETEHPKPKYPGSGYILFVKSCLVESPREHDQDMKDWIKECASKWQNLDEDTKLSYSERALPLMDKYKEELKDWKEKYQEWKKSDASSN